LRYGDSSPSEPIYLAAQRPDGGDTSNSTIPTSYPPHPQHRHRNPKSQSSFLTYQSSITFFFVCENFRKRKFLSLSMPSSSPHLHSPQYDAYNSTPIYITISPSLHSFTKQQPHHRTIHRKMNIRKLLESIPERERDMDRDSDPECKIRAKKGYDRRSGRSVMVFKRSGPLRKKKACGMPDCRICGVFWRKCSSIEELTECKRADVHQAWISRIWRGGYQVLSPIRSFPRRSSPSDPSH
jgi:hypothetical protein